MPSKKVSTADNQQERLKFIGWLVGFTDGEGCFSISIIKNKTSKFGRQIFPEFVITQGEKSLPVLREIKNFFGCGNIFVNRRQDNHKENLYRYCVRSLADLISIIIPFYKRYELKTAKKNDFVKFCKIISLLERKIHISEGGFNKIITISNTMNRKINRSILKSSETKRQIRLSGKI